MLHYFLHPLRMLWRERVDLFWPIWLAITAFAAMLVTWAVPQRNAVSPVARDSRRRPGLRSAILPVTFLALFLACYAAGSLVWEDFTYYDNSHFTNETLLGRNVPLQISPDSGRFFPLCYQEFNLIRHATRSIVGYHALPILQLLLLSAMLLFLLRDDLRVQLRVALLFLLLITPSILISFSGLIYPEWNLIFFLACLVCSVSRFEQTRSTPWAVAAVLASQFVLYYKETAFLLLLSFAAARILFRCAPTAASPAWDFKRLRDPESRLDLCLAFLAVPFLLFYLADMYPHFHRGYAAEYALPLSQVVTSYFQLDLLVWIFAAVVLVRLLLIFRRRVVPSLLWDGLALGGLAYFAGYLILRMYSAYYLAPVDFIAVLYLGRLALLSAQNMGRLALLGFAALLVLVLLQNIALSAFRMYERKNVVHAKAEIGRAIKARYDREPQAVKRLFFPYAQPFPILEFASYLNYLGVPVEQTSSASGATPGILISGQTIHSDGPCGYRTFVCHPASAPVSGDLIVVLPDDFKRASEFDSDDQRAKEVLASYHPYPVIPHWLNPYIDRLRIVSPIFAHDPLPDRWLDASLSMAK